jgi:hypothetical protein
VLLALGVGFVLISVGGTIAYAAAAKRWGEGGAVSLFMGIVAAALYTAARNFGATPRWDDWVLTFALAFVVLAVPYRVGVYTEAEYSRERFASYMDRHISSLRNAQYNRSKSIAEAALAQCDEIKAEYLAICEEDAVIRGLI